MPLIDTATLLRVADRAAYQYGQLKGIMTAISEEGLGYYFDGNPDGGCSICDICHGYVTDL